MNNKNWEKSKKHTFQQNKIEQIKQNPTNWLKIEQTVKQSETNNKHFLKYPGKLKTIETKSG